MRAIAILTVVYAHGHWLIGHIHPGLGLINIDGVTIFFVLSGYLIGRILINDSQKNGCNSVTLLNFWSRRWLRTLPAYFFILTILVLLTLTIASENILSTRTYLYFIFSQNIAWSHPKFFSEAWSLAVEEWFYLSVPLLLFFVVYLTNTSIKRAILIIAVIIIFGSTAIRIVRISIGDIHSTHEWDLAVRKIVIFRLDSLMFGVIGAYFSIFAESWWSKIRKLTFFLGICLFILDQAMQSNVFWRDYIQLTATPFAALCVLPLLSLWKTCPHPLLKVVTFVSLISYSLYLVHLSLVQNFLLALYIDNVPTAFSTTAVIYVLYWSMSISIAYFIWRYVETPFLKIRERDYQINLGKQNTISF